MTQPQTNPFRQAFTIWERTTSAYFDALVRNAAFLTASSTGQMFLAWVGLPTRRDQERALHLLHQIEGRLDDIQFQLEGRESTPQPDA